LADLGTGCGNRLGTGLTTASLREALKQLEDFRRLHFASLLFLGAKNGSQGAQSGNKLLAFGRLASNRREGLLKKVQSHTDVHQCRFTLPILGFRRGHGRRHRRRRSSIVSPRHHRDATSGLILLSSQQAHDLIVCHVGQFNRYNL
jgi:hypothetical protein